MLPRRISSALLPALLLAALLATGCGNSGNTLLTAPTSGTAPLVITCELAAAQVPTGSLTPIALTARVTRAGVPAAGIAVAFTTTGGTLTPAAATSDNAGVAAAFLVPPPTAGAVVVTASAASDPSATSSCGLTVTGGLTNPRLQVLLATPPELAGLTITVLYDESELDLDLADVTVLGPLAASDCVHDVARPATGRIVATLACPTLRPAAGSEMLRLDFVATNSIQTAGAFIVSCSGVNASGATVTTSCSVVVTQI